MKIKAIIIGLIFLTLANCGYQPIYSGKNNIDLLISTIELEGDKNINRKIIMLTGLKENKPQKESKLLQFDFETEKCKCGEPVDFSVSLPFLTLLFENYKISKSELFTINHYADVPPLVNKPILSQIQSFLL